ncbi:MAG: SDR family oxidoreductase [Nocardioides sp.]|nr:SDR family oxidoreductase [Nocardioides sp.]
MDDLADKTFLVTGANTGIGKETVRGLARRGARVVCAGRSEQKTREAMAEVAADSDNGDLDFLHLDLADLASVREAAVTFLGRGERLDVLINNAGLGGGRGMTASGFELAFGTNHIGTFVLTDLLTARLHESAPARVVNLASAVHKNARVIDWEAVREPTRSRTGLAEYAVSKLANVLHARELGRRLEGSGVSTYSVHPGAIASDVWRRVPAPVRIPMKWFMKSTREGALTSLHCATSADVADQTGLYYDRCVVAEPGALVTDDLAAELWTRTRAWLRE